MSEQPFTPGPLSDWWQARTALLYPLDEEVKFQTGVFKEHVIPLLEIDAERTRAITTISGGALVASISVFQLLAEKPLRGEWLLGISWVLFALAIVANIATTTQSGVLRSYTLNIYKKRDLILQEIAPIADVDDRVRRMYELYGAALMEVEKEYSEAAREYGSHAQVAGYAFIFAFLALILFGIVNLY